MLGAALALVLGALARCVRDRGGPAAVVALVALTVVEAAAAVAGICWAPAAGIGASVRIVGPTLPVVLLVLTPSSVGWIRRSWRATPARRP